MRYRLGATALLAAIAALVGPSPAAADPSGGFGPQSPKETTCPAPADAVPGVAGSFAPGTLERLEKVTVKVTSSRAGPLSAPDFTAASGDGSIAFNWAPPINVNGPHVVEAVAAGSTLLLNQPRSATVSRAVCLAVPPKKPANVAQSVGPQAVTITWKANTEGDLIGYQIRRAPKGTSDFKVLGVADKSKASFTDGSVPANGDWQYEVKAARLGVSDTEADLLQSDWSAAPVATVSFVTTTTVAPPTTVTGPAGTAATVPGGSTTATTSGSNSISDSSSATGSTSFRALLDANQRATPRPRAAADTGFDQLLPFAPGDFDQAEAVDPAAEEELAEDPEAGDETTASVERITDDGERRRSLAFVAGGLLTFVLLMQVLFIKGQVKRAPIDLEPEAVPPARPAAARRSSNGKGATPSPDAVPALDEAAAFQAATRPFDQADHDEAASDPGGRPAAPLPAPDPDPTEVFAPPGAGADGADPEPPRAPIPMPPATPEPPPRVFAMGPPAEPSPVTSTTAANSGNGDASPPAGTPSEEGSPRARRAARRVPSPSGGD